MNGLNNIIVSPCSLVPSQYIHNIRSAGGRRWISEATNPSVHELIPWTLMIQNLNLRSLLPLLWTERRKYSCQWACRSKRMGDTFCAGVEGQGQHSSSELWVTNYSLIRGWPQPTTIWCSHQERTYSSCYIHSKEGTNLNKNFISWIVNKDTKWHLQK